jgi:hypothetical protein
LLVEANHLEDLARALQEAVAHLEDLARASKVEVKEVEVGAP